MSIDFTPDHWYLGLFFVGHNDATPPDERVDWLGSVWRPITGGPWTLRYRLRYHKSPGLRVEDDTQWYECTLSPETPLAKITQVLQQSMHAFATQVHGHPDCVWLRCRGNEAITKLLATRKPWLHLQTEPL